MLRHKYLVTLAPEERYHLTGLLSAGRRSALTLTHNQSTAATTGTRIQ